MRHAHQLKQGQIQQEKYKKKVMVVNIVKMKEKRLGVPNIRRDEKMNNIFIWRHPLNNEDNAPWLP